LNHSSHMCSQFNVGGVFRFITIHSCGNRPREERLWNMLKWIRKIAAPVAAMAFLLAVAPVSRAFDVVYYVTGTFTPGAGVVNGAVQGNDYQQSSITVGLSTITFGNNSTVDSSVTGDHSLNFVGLPPSTGANFGAFKLTSTNTSGGDSFSTGFTLTIVQTVPGSGSAASVASLSGTLVGSATSLPTGTNLSLHFVPTVLSLPGASYKINTDASGNFALGTDNGGITTLQGVITSVPLPGVATRR